MNDLEKWRSGCSLFEAAFQYCDEGNRNKYREAITSANRDVFIFIIFADLFSLLSDGRLHAYGHQTAPVANSGPVRVPVHCFDVRPNAVECENDVISASGWRYERVRIIDPNSKLKRRNNSKQIIELEEKCVISEPSLPAAFAAETFHNIKSGAGRPDIWPAAEAALNKLREATPEALKMPALRLLEKFNICYLNQTEIFGLQHSPLSERTLRGHLKRFRQKLAETDGECID